ncbi:hypothetical protein N781_17135 [Pontibacillus halophilus JSM 076056 = DSM 19796]|uniref:Stage II sporulation protein M n=1 Tax=Pontibacillus halophilus JSM 076056 = DSM 19796 TaxID=1385510 RepID=A0A0A5GMU2_9BACI|nr:stage II sporulation protein M [Pontibacillus halophilus]KGX92523.1 hypothetical protein N781_17135 [Pontibacillus halophilus JSM 076056 = DSM 19796]
MQRLYKHEWDKFKESYRLPFLIGMVLTMVFGVVAYYMLLSNPDVVDAYMAAIQQQMERIDLSEEDFGTFTAAWGIMSNNIRVALLTVVLGIVPILIVPYFIPVSTILSISVLSAYYQNVGDNLGELLLKGILPHGITELIAIFLAAAIGFHFSLITFKKLFTEERKSIHWFRAVKECFLSFVLVVFPLLVLSGLIEGYITPAIMGM